MTAPNPEIDPALRALGHAQRKIVDAISAYVLANVNYEWEKTLLTNDHLLTLIGEIVRERDENAKDAARYRWLRGIGDTHSGDIDVCREDWILGGSELDEAIDAAMKAAE